MSPSQLAGMAYQLANQGSSDDVRKLADVVQHLCREVEVIQRTANEALDKAKAAKRAAKG